MSAEIPKFKKEELGFWRKLGMGLVVNYMFSAERNPTRGFIPDALKMDDATLLAYYTAVQISPPSGNRGYRNTDRIHDLLTYKILNTVFDSRNPNFNPEKTKIIIKRALWIAKTNWGFIEDDPNQPEFKITYAKRVTEDISKRLEAYDRPVNSQLS